MIRSKFPLYQHHQLFRGKLIEFCLTSTVSKSAFSASKTTTSPRAHLLYRNDTYKSVKAANPQLAPLEIYKICAQNWQQETGQVREGYFNRAKLEQQNRDEEKLNLNGRSEESEGKNPADSDEESIKNIRKPFSAYGEFCRDNFDTVRNANPALKFPELMKIVSASWKELRDSEKAPYLQRAEEDRQRYRAEKIRVLELRPNFIRVKNRRSDSFRELT